jgi:uncharacterized membrane protein YbjE (DUF340 family)
MTEDMAVNIIDRLEEISGSVQRLADMQREQTAATILAALIQAHDGSFSVAYDGADKAGSAAHLADLLREALK